MSVCRMMCPRCEAMYFVSDDSVPYSYADLYCEEIGQVCQVD